MSFSSNRSRPRQRRHHLHSKRLRLERLEARRVLATYFVTTTDDNTFGICAPDDEAASIDCSIRSAILAAESNDGPDTVVIPDGNYLLDDGSLDVFDSDDLSLVGNVDAPENVVVDAQLDDRVFDLLPNVPISVSFTGLTIQNGVAFDGSGGGGINAGTADLIVDQSIIQNNFASEGFFGEASSGGGIQASGNVTITNSQLLNNEATEHGGGLSFQPFGEGVSLQITDTTVGGNRAAIDGGGIFVNSGGVSSSVTIGRSIIQNNEADDSGGGVFVLDTDVTVFESTFFVNTAVGAQGADGVGGGFYLRTDSGNEQFEIQDTTFEANAAAGGGGGAIFENADGTLLSTTFEENSVTRPGFGPNLFAEGGGGAVFVGLTRIPSVSADDLTVRLNSAPAGGGIAVVDTDLSLTGSVISENGATNSLAGGGGIGAIATTLAGSSLEISDTSVVNNTSEGEGGGIGAIDVDVTLRSLIVEQNSALGGRAGGIGILGNARSPSTTIEQSTIRDNEASAEGGGIYAPGPLTIQQTVISGNTADSGAGLYFGTGAGNDASLLVTDSTISGNNAAFSGGGVNLESALDPDAEARFVDTTIDGNVAVEDGGGIASIGMPITLTGSVVSNNVTGGGIESDGGGIFMEGDLTVRNTSFLANSTELVGGAMFYIGGNLDIADSSFVGNQSGAGGGAVYLESVAADIDASWENSLFEGNQSQNGEGGAIGSLSSAENDITTILLDSTFSENRAASGGAVFSGASDSLSGSSRLTVQRTTFANNAADLAGRPPAPDRGRPDTGDGGAIRLLDGNATIENSTFSGNIADGSGGGLFVDNLAAVTVDLVHATFTLNSAQSGGGLSQTGPSGVAVGNTVIAANAASIFDPDVSGTFTSNDGNFIGDVGDASGFDLPLDQVGPGANGPLDPQLGPLVLQSQLDRTSTHAPLPGSPLIDAAGSTVSLAVDQRETVRPIDGDGDSIAIADIGAVEGEEGAAAGNGVQGHLYCDANGNVEEDPGEQLVGVTVFADLNGNQIQDVGEPFAMTDANGDYLIPDLVPGQVSIITSLADGCNTVSPKVAVRTTLGVGDLARSIAAVDIDADGALETGFMDLVVANELSSELTILRNDAGSFSIAQRIPLSERPQSVTVWQPDGALPTYAVAAAGTTETKGKVFLIEPTGITTITVGDGPLQVVMEDFNGDGLPDLLTSAFRSSDLNLLLGGSTESIQLTTGRNVLGSAVGDFDGDGQQDIVVGGAGFGNDAESEIKVLLGNGDGTFREGSSLAVAKDVVQLAGVDLDENGTHEILALAKSGSLISLRLQEQVGVPGVNELTVISSTALDRGVNSFAVGKFNQDDLLDVAVTNLDQESVEVLVGAGDGRFGSVNTTSNVPSPSDLVIADFNGDGVGDVAVANLFADDPDQNAQYRLPSTATILQFNIASETVFLSGDTVATVDFAFPAANPDLLLDVNGDMELTPADALAVINALNRTALAEGEQSWDRFQRDTDVNRDGTTTPLDALLIINQLNRRAQAGEGEAAALAIDYDTEEDRRRRERERALAVDEVLTSYTTA